ncbi:ATP-binding protein [Tenacibaculum sp. S7007]|uniref:ATP-binding protein n=1 Tax=Tenacibaculum pelagium TaxID=2759527 RepID=A0A839APG1_9FLAO|nr:ATP-binding protein [Tenacibaculum pelagium]MBA6156972.1 ATP-binding protein [Tenacibaculum pelagium]
MQQKIVLIGGPGTGKSSILREFIKRGYECMPEISREVTLKAQKEGIDQLFLEQPLLFSQMLLEGREQQYLDAEKSDAEIIFFDRGIPDVHAYMNYLESEYPPIYKEKSNKYIYTKVFMCAPWKNIYRSDNERYETFEQAVKIDTFLKDAYEEIGYEIIDVPFGTVKERCDFILHSL